MCLFWQRIHSQRNGSSLLTVKAASRVSISTKNTKNDTCITGKLKKKKEKQKFKGISRIKKEKERKKEKKDAETRIRTWVTAATTQCPNH